MVWTARWQAIGAIKKTELVQRQCLEDVRSVTLIKLGGRPDKDLRKHLSLKEAASIGGCVGQVCRYQRC